MVSWMEGGVMLVGMEILHLPNRWGCFTKANLQVTVNAECSICYNQGTILSSRWGYSLWRKSASYLMVSGLIRLLPQRRQFRPYYTNPYLGLILFEWRSYNTFDVRNIKENQTFLRIFFV
jgi:hypothetical protein